MAQWLRQYATSQLVAVSNPDGVTGIFHWYNPSGRTHIDLGSIQPLTNEHKYYFLGGKGSRCVRLTTLPTSCDDCHEIWEPQLRGTLGACPGLYRGCFTFAFTYTKETTVIGLGLGPLNHTRNFDGKRLHDCTSDTNTFMICCRHRALQSRWQLHTITCLSQHSVS